MLTLVCIALTQYDASCNQKQPGSLLSITGTTHPAIGAVPAQDAIYKNE